MDRRITGLQGARYSAYQPEDMIYVWWPPQPPEIKHARIEVISATADKPVLVLNRAGSHFSDPF